jgi:uncharacterized protein YdaU (DUF1376 family)
MRASWWWIDRYRQSSSYKDFTPEQRGMYRDLLDEVWLRENYCIPNDDRIIGLIVGDPVGWLKNKSAILSKFRLTENGWTHDVALEIIKESERRATNQKNYRDRKRERVDNKVDNADDNNSDNNSDNKADSKSKSKSLSIVSVSVKEKKVKKKEGFIIPTLAEVSEYCLERKNNVNPERWMAFYESKGWMIGKNKMKDWKAAVRTWENGGNHGSTRATGSQNPRPGSKDYVYHDPPGSDIASQESIG